ncbi:hypothetical protein [Paenibacillus spongiae]|uniref:Uncharacterized protein n=1 Tax=Paenibacillus spongiae TaxID=2909671 RepID=A0ABY5SFQ0_9BACL|nr:hypothetical protein [Paenibacillus spongiae]UVI31093.1 hypothetical protein L1F29_04345 [Paenibacillus spongiae]
MVNKAIKGIMVISIMLASTGVAAAEPLNPASASVHASPMANKKMTAATFNKKLAEQARTSGALKKQQGALLIQLKNSESKLTDQLVELLEAEDAVGFLNEERTQFFAGTMAKLAARDEGVAEYLEEDELDLVSSLSSGWLSASKQVDKLKASYAKLGAAFKTYVNQKLYQEALNARNEQIGLDKKLNAFYSGMIYKQDEINDVLYDVLNPYAFDDEWIDDSDHEDVYDGGYNSVWDSVYGQ